MPSEKSRLQVLRRLCGNRIKSKNTYYFFFFLKKKGELLIFKDMRVGSGASDGKNRLKLFHYLNSLDNNVAFKP